MVAKIVCKNCGELPFVIPNVPQNIEADEIKFEEYGKKLLGNTKCKKCGSNLILKRGNLKSKKIIDEYNKLQEKIFKLAQCSNFDSIITESNTLVIDRIIKEVTAVSSLFNHKNILCFVLVGENAPDGTITFRTQTFYSGIYTIFPEIKASLLRNSIDAMEKNIVKDTKLPANKINDFLNLQEDNIDLKKEIETLKKEKKEKELVTQQLISDYNSQLSKKTAELKHFKELYGELKKKQEGN